MIFKRHLFLCFSGFESILLNDLLNILGFFFMYTVYHTIEEIYNDIIINVNNQICPLVFYHCAWAYMLD